MQPTLAETIIEEKLRHWSDCADVPETTLLRMALLRDVAYTLHPEKSRCLATGRKEEATQIKQWEAQIEACRDAPNLLVDYVELLKQDPTQFKKKHHLPEALFRRVQREKLLRYDRKWENALASEAIRIQWQFWLFDAWIHVSNLQKWNSTFSQRLWPNGVILFAESGAQNDIIRSDESSIPIWRGHWVVLVSPRFKHASELRLESDPSLNFPKAAPTPPKWSALFP